MYIQSELTLWQRFVEWCFPWRKHARQRALRENMRWVARKIGEEENGGLR